MLLRPESEASTEQRIVVQRRQNLSVETYGLALRVQPDGSRYFIFQGATVLRITRLTGAGVSATVANLAVPQPSPGDTVTLDASIVTSAAKPLITATFTDSTTGSTKTLSAVDSTSGRISTAGQCGIDLASAGSFSFQHATVYADGTASATVTPSAVHSGAVNTVLYLTGTGTAWTKATTFTLSGSDSNGATLGNSVFVDATHFKVVLANAGTAADSLVLRDSTSHTTAAVSVTSPAIIATPAQIADTTPETVLNVVGTDQTWTASAPQFKVVGLSDVSIVRTKVLDNTTAQVTIKTGASTGSVILQDLNAKYPTATQFTVVHAIKVNDANILWSPYNWDIQSSSIADSNYAGSYVKVGIDTTSTGPISILFDPSPNLGGGLTPDNYPTIGWSLNPVSSGGKWNYVQLRPDGASVPVAANAPAGHYELWIYVKSIRGSGDGGRWSPSCRKLRLVGIQVPAGTQTAAVTRRSTNAIMFGDSITQGAGTLGFTSASNDDAMQCWVRSLADALGAEYGNIGIAGLKWSGSSAALPAFYSSANVPPDTYSYYEGGRTRLIAGKLSPAPDYVFVNVGTNDLGTNISANVASTIAGLRAISGPNAGIYLVLPFSGFEHSPVSGVPGGFNKYMAANPNDTKVFVLDCGTSIAPYAGLNSTTGVTENQFAFDGLHPKNDISLSFGAKIAELVHQASGGSASQ